MDDITGAATKAALDFAESSLTASRAYGALE
jgi:hypothetical protein